MVSEKCPAFQFFRICRRKRSTSRNSANKVVAMIITAYTRYFVVFHSPSSLWTSAFSMLLSDSVPGCMFGKLLMEDGRELVPCLRRATSIITRPAVRLPTRTKKKKNQVTKGKLKLFQHQLGIMTYNYEISPNTTAGYLQDASGDILCSVFEVFAVNREDLITSLKAAVNFRDASFHLSVKFVS